MDFMASGAPKFSRAVSAVIPFSRLSIGNGVAQARQIRRQEARRTVRVTGVGRRVKKNRINATLLEADDTQVVVGLANPPATG
jgi:hypothetical protein